STYSGSGAANRPSIKAHALRRGLLPITSERPAFGLMQPDGPGILSGTQVFRTASWRRVRFRQLVFHAVIHKKQVGSWPRRHILIRRVQDIAVEQQQGAGRALGGTYPGLVRECRQNGPIG